MPVNDFQRDLRESDVTAHLSTLRPRLMKFFEGARDIETATKEEDKFGTDFWVIFPQNKRISLDVKVMRKPFRGLPIELWSVKEQKIPGWCIDPSKHTDYIVWYWLEEDEIDIVPFHILQKVVLTYGNIWADTFGLFENNNKNKDYEYHSVFILVPRDVFHDAHFKLCFQIPRIPIVPLLESMTQNKQKKAK